MNEKDNHSDYLKLNHIYDMEEQAPKKRSASCVVSRGIIFVAGVLTMTLGGMKLMDQLDDAWNKD